MSNSVSILPAILSSIGIAFCLIGAERVRALSRVTAPRARKPSSDPPVTMLKPLCGTEPLFEQAIETCFNQSYPNYQIVFGVQDPKDPALDILVTIIKKYPDRKTTIVVDDAVHGKNGKISNLINMSAFADHDILLISDSDLHLPENTIEVLVSELAHPDCGIVTAAYCGIPGDRSSIAAALGVSHVSHSMLPGILIARAMGREDCFGCTTMLYRETLERIGGFAAFGDRVAEDNMMGRRVRELGLSVRLAPVIPATTIPESRFQPLWHHELRWMRTVRGLAPWSLVGSSLQYPLFWSGLACLATRGALWSILLFFSAWLIRWACAKDINKTLTARFGAPVVATPFMILPFRDLLSVLLIAVSFGDNKVTWRGRRIDMSRPPESAAH